ncbi:MAG: L-threonylcarbamoyladenylate synthase [Ignavibacteriaceae bacterium]
MAKNNKKAKAIVIEKDYNHALDYAAETFFAGKVFVYPTDTIYGFGGNIFSLKTVKRIIEIKGREASKGFILLMSSVDSLSRYAEIKDVRQLRFLRRIFPNPISVVMKLSKSGEEELGVKSAAFRIPDHKFCFDLCERIKLPLISTSVNRSGTAPLNDYTEIKGEFENEVDVIFYSIVKSEKSVSTLIDLTGKNPVLLREGKIKFPEIIKKCQD